MEQSGFRRVRLTEDRVRARSNRASSAAACAVAISACTRIFSSSGSVFWRPNTLPARDLNTKWPSACNVTRALLQRSGKIAAGVHV